MANVKSIKADKDSQFGKNVTSNTILFDEFYMRIEHSLQANFCETKTKIQIQEYYVCEKW